MHNSFLKIIFVITCLSVNYLSAQVLAPDFQCLKSDTLIWIPANNTCGPFESYDVYFSNARLGPYSLLTTVSDPAQTSFFHPNPTDDTRFYYLESSHDCPGQLSLKSDTLSNRSPEIPQVTSLTVIGNNVELIWQKSTSPETIGYIIYRVTNVGTIPIDTVYNDVTFLDTNADPLNQDESYYILAVDACGNTSLFGLPQSTNLLNLAIIPCLQQIELTWTPTINWASGIATQEIWIAENGTAPILAGRVDGNTGNYAVENVTQGLEYCIFVKAISNGNGFEVSTNKVCVTPTIIQSVNELYFKNINIQNNGNVEVEWIWNDDAELKSATLNRNLLGGNTNQDTPLGITPPLQNRNNLIVPDTDGKAGQWEFRISTTDECDSIVNSGFASPIFLSIGSSGGLSSTCFWSPLILPNAKVQHYDVYRSINGIFQVVGQVDANTFEFTDKLSPNDVTNGDMCYTVRATSVLTHSDGSEEEIRSSSNQLCKTVSAQIFMPNAFSPRGRNQILKPIVSFGSPQEFRMLVYNRYGGLVFETDDINFGWNGKYDGRDAPMGIYSYLIKMVQQDGQSENLTGTVMLVR